MPQIFKALASITVWALFIFGWIFTVHLPITSVTSGKPPDIAAAIIFATGVASFILSVCAMKLRRMLE